MNEEQKAFYQVDRYIEILKSKVKDHTTSVEVTVENKNNLLERLSELESELLNFGHIYGYFPKSVIDIIDSYMFEELKRCWNCAKIEFLKLKPFLGDDQ